MIRWLLLLVALGLAVPATADELRPGYLELTQQDAQHWRMVWKAPVLGGLATHARPLVPPQCRQSAPTARLEGAQSSEVSGMFGDEFTLALRALPLGQWQGPVASGVGLHLVRVDSRAAPIKPSLAAVRQRITNDWRADAIARARAADYARMLRGYDVVIALPK